MGMYALLMKLLISGKKLVRDFEFLFQNARLLLRPRFEVDWERLRGSEEAGAEGGIDSDIDRSHWGHVEIIKELTHVDELLCRDWSAT